MFSPNKQAKKRDLIKTGNDKTTPPKRRTALWIGLLFACCLLLAGAAPWTATESNASGEQNKLKTSGTGFTSSVNSSNTILRNLLGFGDASIAWKDKTVEPQSAPQFPSSSDGVWQGIDNKAIVAAAGQSPAASYQAVRLNKEALEQQLRLAPMEFSGDLRKSPAILSLPMPDGSFSRFHIEESPVMEADLAARLPEVRTYRGQGIDDPTATTRFDWTPLGFHGIVLSSQETIFVEPAQRGDISLYVTYANQDRFGSESFACGVTENDVRDAEARGVYRRPKGDGSFEPEVLNGSTLRTYRLAVATTGEWFGIYGGGSVANAQTAITSIINLVDAIYEREVAVRFTLVNNTNIIFTNSAGDPYSTNGADATSLNENQATLDNVAFLGSANYDVGHLFGGITGLPVGAGAFSGLAQLGVVCTAGTKARGVSTMGNNPAVVTAGIFVGGVAHELAHQFSAPHTFNTNQASCGPQRSAGSAYEVGGGSTLMSYSICGADNLQPHTGEYFNIKSLEDIVGYATTSGTCASTTATGNTAPTVTGPGNFTIPISTPFVLNATASDTNGPLTYSWEEYDLGASTVGTYTDDGSRPLFRGYNPTPVSSRTFPSLTYILNNANTPPGTYSLNATTFLTGEVLPTTSRSMVFQVVVRDNQTTGGGINTATSTLTVSNAAGPFQVTAPNTAVAWVGGAAQNVTWNVNNTNNAPVSTANVKITLSTNGGLSFPVILAASTANDGTESINVPNGISTSTARVKVEAIGNIFFDISDTNFSVQPGDGCPAITDISPKVGIVGTVVSITGNNFTGVTAVTFNGVPASSFTVNSNINITATTPAGATGGPITLTKPGCTLRSSSGYTVCPAAATILSVDDGSVNAGGRPGAANYFVNRLTPGSYPSTLTDVQAAFLSALGFTAGTNITIIAGTTTSGSPDNTFFTQTLSTTVGTVNTLNTYTLPNPITLTSSDPGDFVVGYIVDPAGIFPAQLDTTSIQNRSYYSDNQGNSYTQDAGNYPIRARIFSGNCNAPTAVPATISGSVTTADGAPLAGVTMNLSGARSARAITDSNGNYRFANVDTDNFYTVTPALVNYHFGPESRSFSLLANKTDAVFTATRDAVTGGNAIDSAGYFVRQHYLDFLGREPDESGFNFWSEQILSCGSDAACIERRTINVSAAYFLSIEFQQTGGLVDGLYRASYGRRPMYAEFMPDTQTVAQNVVVGDGDWLGQLTANKQAFVEAWVQRAAFRATYDGLTNNAFVDRLIAHTGGSFNGDHEALVSGLNSGTMTRTEVLRQVVENEGFISAKRNEMFVMMEYFGYLRRDPDESGYQFWLTKLNQFGGNFEQAEMVKAFINSGEYRQRFSQ